MSGFLASRPHSPPPGPRASLPRLDPARVGEVILGCVTQHGEQAVTSLGQVEAAGEVGGDGRDREAGVVVGDRVAVGEVVEVPVERYAVHEEGRAEAGDPSG